MSIMQVPSIINDNIITVVIASLFNATSVVSKIVRVHLNR